MEIFVDSAIIFEDVRQVLQQLLFPSYFLNTQIGNWHKSDNFIKLQGSDVQSEVLADDLQEPLRGDDGRDKGGAAARCATGHRICDSREGVSYAVSKIYEDGRHAEVWRFRLRHFAPPPRVR